MPKVQKKVKAVYVLLKFCVFEKMRCGTFLYKSQINVRFRF